MDIHLCLSNLFSSLCHILQDGALALRNICVACDDILASNDNLDSYISRAAVILPTLWYAESLCSAGVRSYSGESMQRQNDTELKTDKADSVFA